MSNQLKWEKLLSDKRLRKSGEASNERNPFESDYGRVIYSPAIRRMHDKTQVFPLSDDDNIHTRLTHSQEVMSIGYTFGIKLVNEIFSEKNTEINQGEFSFLENDHECLRSKLLRTIPVILQTVCLFHDIGNTPFGHFGEDSISNYFKEYFKEGKLLCNEQLLDFTQYDGNAQGLRVLTKLQVLDDIYGLNLTYAVLGTYLKYPNKGKKQSNDVNHDDKKIALKKHGVLFSEVKHFEEIVSNCGLKVGENYARHPLCFLMEAADTIAYRTMDVEDGFNKGLYNFNYIVEKIEKQFVTDITISNNIQYIKNLNTSDKSKMVRFRILLIEYLVKKAFEIFVVNYKLIMNGNFNKELLDEDELRIDDILGDICTENIYDSEEVNTLEVTGNSVIKGLLDFYISAIIDKKNGLERKAYNLISKSIINIAILESKVKLREKSAIDKCDISKFDFKDFQALDEYSKFRIIIDFISGMTDKYALKHYQIISGHKLK